MRVAAEGFCELLLPALRDTAPSARPFTCFSDSLFSRPEDLCAGVLLLGVTLLLGFLMVPALFFALLLLEVLLLTELLLTHDLMVGIRYSDDGNLSFGIRD